MLGERAATVSKYKSSSATEMSGAKNVNIEAAQTNIRIKWTIVAGCWHVVCGMMSRSWPFPLRNCKISFVGRAREQIYARL